MVEQWQLSAYKWLIKIDWFVLLIGMEKRYLDTVKQCDELVMNMVGETDNELIIDLFVNTDSREDYIASLRRIVYNTVDNDSEELERVMTIANRQWQLAMLNAILNDNAQSQASWLYSLWCNYDYPAEWYDFILYIDFLDDYKKCHEEALKYTTLETERIKSLFVVGL